MTTNPSLIRRAIQGEEREKGTDLHQYVEEICKTAGKGRPVSLEVLSKKADKMVEEAKVLYEKFNPVAENVVTKIPVNATLVMSPEQGLLAAKAGATYVSPFAGRIDDFIMNGLGIDFEKGDYYDYGLVEKISRCMLEEYFKNSGTREISQLYSDEEIKKLKNAGEDKGVTSGVDLVIKVVKILEKCEDIKTNVIASSIRNPRQVRQVARAGCDIATIPFNVIKEMLRHPKTEEGIISFCNDAASANYEELF